VKLRSRSGIALLSLAVVSLFETSAYAAKGIFNANVSPSEALIATSTLMTITAEIAADVVNPLIVSSVVVYETTASGTPIAQLGRLYDDGTHGDAVAHDTIYTMQLVVNEPAPRTRYIRISAAYSGIRNRYLSPVIRTDVFAPLPANLVDAASATVQSIESSFFLNVNALGVDGARQQALTSALGNPNIGPNRVNLSGPNLSLVYHYTDPNTGFSFDIRGIAILSDPANPTDGPGRSTPAHPIPNSKSPGNDKVLIFGPGYHTADPQNAIVDHAASQFADTEFMTFSPAPPSITGGAAADLEVVKTWGEYGTVIIHTHGGLWDLNGTQEVVLVSGTSASLWNRLTYAFDLLADRIGVAGDGRFVFYPSFVTKYVSGMKDTFLYLGACESLQNDTLWNALSAKGAKVAFGWSETRRSGIQWDHVCGADRSNATPRQLFRSPFSAAGVRCCTEQNGPTWGPQCDANNANGFRRLE
jgi:hypothetical protein